MHHLKTAATVCLVCVLVRVGGMGSKVGTCNKEHLSITAVNQICQITNLCGWWIGYTVWMVEIIQFTSILSKVFDCEIMFLLIVV